ncbi:MULTISPECIES: YqeB family protein [unclassified Nocardiopsis]|uniref:YqeB family protein n=1 Tax=Nocardiopsis TaxID=2013 RepID=UPI00387B4987
MTAQPAEPPTVVRHGAAYHLFVWGVLPPLGAAAGWLLSLLPGWLLALPTWVLALPLLPGRDGLELLEGISGPVLTLVLVVIGLVAGAFLALMAYDEVITVEADEDAVRVTAAGETTEVPRERFGVAFLDGKELVVLDTATAEAVRATTDHAPKRLRAALEARGYAWSEGDPHADAFRRWLDGTPDLDAHTQALLRTRQAALEKKDTADAAELRAALAEHGLVVHDRDGRQHWRALPAGDA